MNMKKETEEKLNQFKQNGSCPECKFVSVDYLTAKTLGSKEHLAYAGAFGPNRECSVANLQAKKEREERDIPPTFPVGGDTSHDSFEDPEEVHEVEELQFDKETQKGINELIGKLNDEVAAETVKTQEEVEEESDFVRLNRDSTRQGEVKSNASAGSENIFTPAANRDILDGNSEKDVIEKWADLIGVMIFDLENKAFILTGGRGKRNLSGDRERSWMSNGLLVIIEQIEKNRKVPHTDYEWWVILKEIIRLLRERKVETPIAVLQEDLYVLDGQVKSLLFVPAQ